MSRFYPYCIAGCLITGFLAVCAPQKVTGQAKQKVENNQSGILYGKNFAYAISAPKGWIMDDETARDLGLSVVFYRQGETWENGGATMYVNVIGREKGLKAKDVIADDIATFKKRNPKMKITQDKTLQTKDARSAMTYVFSYVNRSASDERVAYVEMPTVVLLITLTAKTTTSYKNGVADHTSLVNSVAFLTSKVEIKKAK